MELQGKKRVLQMKKFNNVMDTHRKNLELYVPVVARVHGPSHPVFYKVQDQYNSLMNKVNHNDTDLNPEFTELRAITDNYLVPSDTCETYEAVYHMLQELDEAYQEQ